MAPTSASKTFPWIFSPKCDLGILKHFAVKLHINEKIVAKARATSKKKAEEMASKRAYYALQNKIDKD